MRATAKGLATTSSRTPPVSGKSSNTASSPSGASCTWSIRRTRPWTSPTECSLSFAATTAPPATQLDEGMIPTKNLLAIKQYIRDKPVRWGIKSFLLCEAKTGYILDAEIYTGWVKDRHWSLLGSAGSVVRRLMEKLAGHQQEPHAVHGPLLQLRHALPPDRTWLVRIPVQGSSVCHRLKGLQAHPLPEQLPQPEESVHCKQACRGQVRTVDRATACGGLHQVSKPPGSFHTILHECSASGYSNFASRFRYMGAKDKNNQITRLNNTRCHYRWPRRLFMKFLVWAAYNAYIIMDSYRPHPCAGHHFRTLHMFVDELCLQLVGDYRRAVHRHEAQAQQSDLLRLQGVGQHNPERSAAPTGNNLCVVCCTKYNKYLKKHPATAYRNMPHKRRKTTSWCSTCHKYLCLRVGSTCWSDYHTKV